MINITLNQVRLLKSLSLGERFPLSNLKGKIFQQLLDEHVQSAKPPVHLFKTKRFYFEVLFQNEASLLEQNQTAFKWTSNPI